MYVITFSVTHSHGFPKRSAWKVGGYNFVRFSNPMFRQSHPPRLGYASNKILVNSTNFRSYSMVKFIQTLWYFMLLVFRGQM